MPHFVAHYWPAYDHELTASEPRPGTFLQHLASGRKLVWSSRESHHMVENIAEGVLRLAAILNPLAHISRRKRKHRYMRELLADNPELETSYLEFVSLLITGNADTMAETWDPTWAPRIRAVAAAIAGAAADSAAARGVSSWSSGPSAAPSPPSVRSATTYSVRRQKTRKCVSTLGRSIRSRARTHTATLVLETSSIAIISPRSNAGC